MKKSDTRKEEKLKVNILMVSNKILAEKQRGFWFMNFSNNQSPEFNNIWLILFPVLKFIRPVCTLQKFVTTKVTKNKNIKR